MRPENPRERMELFAAQGARGDHEGALATIQDLIAKFPAQIPLHWYRARTLRTLGRDTDAMDEIEGLIKLKPDFAPAWLMHAELIAASDQGRYPEGDLRQALKLDPGLARAHLLLSRWLSDNDRHAEAEDSLERALKVDPLQSEAYADRGSWHLRDAAQGFGDQGAEDPNILIGPSGHRWSRSHLQLARADFEHSLEIRDDAETRLRLAQVLNHLQDFEAALAAFDAVLFAVPLDDPRHGPIREMRALAVRGSRSEAIDPSEFSTQRLHRPSADELDAAAPVRTRRISREEARERFGDGDEDDARALEYALDLYQLAHPSEPEFVRTSLERYPKFQQENALATARMLGAQAFRMVGDFSPEHRLATLGPTLLRFYVSGDGVTCASSFCTEPQVQGWFAKLLLKLRGKWKQTAITECESVFDDGSFLITTNAPTVTPFLTKGSVERVQLAAGTPPPGVYSRHRARIERYRRDHPHATAERVDTDERIFDLQRRIAAAKATYRLNIGYVDDKELRHLLGEDYDYLAQKLRVKLAQIVAAATDG